MHLPQWPHNNPSLFNCDLEPVWLSGVSLSWALGGFLVVWAQTPTHAKATLKCKKLLFRGPSRIFQFYVLCWFVACLQSKVSYVGLLSLLSVTIIFPKYFTTTFQHFWTPKVSLSWTRGGFFTIISPSIMFQRCVSSFFRVMLTSRCIYGKNPQRWL